MKLIKLLFPFMLLFILFFCCSNEKSSWDNACLADSTAAYIEFLESYPNGQFADSAKLKIEGRKILIYTVPNRLNIYFAKVDTNEVNLKALGGKWAKIYDKTDNKHYVIDKVYLKGKSPIVLDDNKHYVI